MDYPKVIRFCTDYITHIMSTVKPADKNLGFFQVSLNGTYIKVVSCKIKLLGKYRCKQIQRRDKTN